MTAKAKNLLNLIVHNRLYTFLTFCFCFFGYYSIRYIAFQLVITTDHDSLGIALWVVELLLFNTLYLSLFFARVRHTKAYISGGLFALLALIVYPLNFSDILSDFTGWFPDSYLTEQIWILSIFIMAIITVIVSFKKKH